VRVTQMRLGQTLLEGKIYRCTIEKCGSAPRFRGFCIFPNFIGASFHGSEEVTPGIIRARRNENCCQDEQGIFNSLLECEKNMMCDNCQARGCKEWRI
jgi:hypothetical protein